MRSARTMGSAMSILIIITVLLLYGCRSVTSDHPILVLVTNSGFGTYSAEILKAEGFNEFLIDSLADRKISSDFLKRFGIVILAETNVSSSEKKMLAEYVSQGGNLVAFRPDKKLSEIFGIKLTGRTVSEGYIRIDTISPAGRGLIGETIQFHGISDIYEPDGAAAIASLCNTASDPGGSPSVVTNNYGKGHAAAFSYNLPKSIVYTRQGNPVWAGEERDKVDGPTATDLFYPAASEKQWNDPSRIAYPQADEQMRLLSHILEIYSASGKPLPRFWYFPDQYKCLFIFTIDGENSPETAIDSEITDVQGKGGKASLYEIGTYIKASKVSKWRSNGHEVAIHYNDVPNYADPTYSNMNTVFDTMTASFRKAYGISPVTGRNHWVVWCSRDSAKRKQFAEQAAIEEKYGIGLDCNYYQFGGNNVYPNWIGDVGHFTGSGIPMKFADVSGKILNVYQSNTQLPDETWLKDNIEKKCKILIDRSLDNECYAFLNANFHTWYWKECREAGLRVLDYCNKRGVPVRTAESVLHFLKMKDEAFFTDIKWANSRLTFIIRSTVSGADGLTFMLPVTHGGSNLAGVSVNGRSSSFQSRMIKGSEYAMVTVKSGLTSKISAVYK